MEFLKELWAFLRVRKKLWLAPIIIVMLIGIWVAHLDNGFYPTYDTYGYQLCLIGLAYVLTIVGGGNLSLDKRLF